MNSLRKVQLFRRLKYLLAWVFSWGSRMKILTDKQSRTEKIPGCP